MKHLRFRDKIIVSNCAIGELKMAVKYDKLFEQLKDREIKESKLTKDAGFSANIMTRIRRNQYVSLESIEAICRTLDCKVEDILDFTE